MSKIILILTLTLSACFFKDANWVNYHKNKTYQKQFIKTRRVKYEKCMQLIKKPIWIYLSKNQKFINTDNKKFKEFCNLYYLVEEFK